MGRKIWSVGEEVAASDLNNAFLFGGDGSDGALTVASGTTTIDASSANIVIKNYTSIDISAGAILDLSNKASDGTILILKSQGDVTIAGTIDLDGDGANTDTTAFGIMDENTHDGGSGTTGSSTESGGAGGNIYSLKGFYVTSDVNKLFRKFILVTPGSGGGSGGDSTEHEGGHATGGAGGVGGGAIVIECAGELDFTSVGEINVNGLIGATGGYHSSHSSAGGGGGGAAGMALVLYNNLTANDGTVNAKGGAGGAGGPVDGSGTSNYPGTGGGGGGQYTSAGGAGGATISNTGQNGITASGSGSGSGGGSGTRASGTQTSGGSQGASDSNHYLVTENKDF